MKKLFCVIFIFALPACAAQMAEIQYYQLPAPAVENRAVSSGAVNILVAPVEVADFLAGSGLVYQLDQVEYKTAQNYRWAEPLSTQLQNSLAGELRLHLPKRMILTQRRSDSDLTISVNITGFHGRYGGQAVVSGEWMISGPGRPVVQKRFEQTVQQESDGYKPLVEALYQGWRMEAVNIAEALKGL